MCWYLNYCCLTLLVTRLLCSLAKTTTTFSFNHSKGQATLLFKGLHIFPLVCLLTLLTLRLCRALSHLHLNPLPFPQLIFLVCRYSHHAISAYFHSQLLTPDYRSPVWRNCWKHFSGPERVWGLIVCQSSDAKQHASYHCSSEQHAPEEDLLPIYSSNFHES